MREAGFQRDARRRADSTSHDAISGESDAARLGLYKLCNPGQHCLSTLRAMVLGQPAKYVLARRRRRGCAQWRPVSKLYANLRRMTGYRAPGFQALAPSGQRSAGARPPRPTFAMAHPRIVPCRTAQSRAARVPGRHCRIPRSFTAATQCVLVRLRLGPPPFFC